MVFILLYVDLGVILATQEVADGQDDFQTYEFLF
jgi:hypothetical protein